MRRDFHEVLMDDVAAAAGVGKGTLYRYFQSKDDLFSALVLDGMARLRFELEAAAERGANPIERLEHVVRAFLDHFWPRRYLLALLHRHEHKRRDAEMREWARRRAAIGQVIEGVLAEGAAAGLVGEVPPHAAAEMMIGLMRGVDRSRQDVDTIDELVSRVLDVFVCGVGTETGRQLRRRRRASA